MTGNRFDEWFRHTLKIHEQCYGITLNKQERGIAYNFFLQGIAASQMHPELNE